MEVLAQTRREARLPTGTLVFDPRDPAYHQDPYPLYARLREEAPLHRSPSSPHAWVVSRYVDCLRLLRDPRVSLIHGLGLGEETNPPPDPSRRVKRAARQRCIRRLVAKAVTPWTIERLRPAAERLTRCLVETTAEREVTDLVPQLAEPLGMGLIGELLELPVGERSLLREWLPAIAATVGAEDQRREIRELCRVAHARFSAYLGEHLAEQERVAGSGLLARLVDAEDGGVRLGARERVAVARELALAGYLTSRGLVANTILALLRQRAAARAVRDDRTAVASAVDECLRWDPPVQLGARIALASFELRGRRIAAGDELWLLLGAANRDPRAFRNPDRFDLARTGAPHLTGGFGGQFCIGAELARLAAEVGVAGLFRRVSRLVLASDELDRKPTAFLRSPERLPVAVAV